MIVELASKVRMWSQLLTITDYIDILLLFFIFYTWLKWVQRYQAQLLIFLYGYSVLGLLSYFLSLLSVCTFILYSAPLVFLFFSGAAFYKQYAVTWYGVPRDNSLATDWLAELLRALFSAKSTATHFACLIELNADVVLSDKMLVSVPFHYRLGMLLLGESLQNAHNCWHFTADGKLRDITVPFTHKGPITDWQQFVQDSLLYTSTTPSLVLIFNYTSRTFSLIVKGKVYESVEAASVVRMVHRLMEESNSLEKGKKYAESNRPTLF